MKGETLPFIKVVSALFDHGVWAKMSAAARALYPVLLRFSDGHFRGVFPGTGRLLEMTGFKHKKSIREARNELIELGLISVTRGSGRKNTYYHFRFDWVGGASVSPREIAQAPGAGYERSPVGVHAGALAEGLEAPPHNQIHISITNHVQSALPAELEALRRRFGEDKVRLALSECSVAGITPDPANVEKILGGRFKLWSRLRETLSMMISPESLRVIETALVSDDGTSMMFDHGLPSHLKKILTRHGGRVEFVHSSEKPAAQ